MPKLKTKKPSVFAQNLVNLRKSRQLTQVQLAEELGLTKSAIAYYEAAAKNPRLQTLQKIADYFGSSPEFLLADHQRGNKAKPGPDSRMEILFERLEHLSPAKQRMILNMLEAALDSQ